MPPLLLEERAPSVRMRKREGLMTIMGAVPHRPAHAHGRLIKSKFTPKKTSVPVAQWISALDF